MAWGALKCVLSNRGLGLSAEKCLYYYYYYYFGVCCARAGESEDTLSVHRPQPHTTNLWKEVKDKTVGDKKGRADHANRKALALLLKPTSPTPSNTGLLRSFQRDTEGNNTNMPRLPLSIKEEKLVCGCQTSPAAPTPWPIVTVLCLSVSCWAHITVYPTSSW